MVVTVIMVVVMARMAVHGDIGVGESDGDCVCRGNVLVAVIGANLTHLNHLFDILNLALKGRPLTLPRNRENITHLWRLTF